MLKRMIRGFRDRDSWAISSILLGIVILPLTSACAEKWIDIPAIYRGRWIVADDASTWRKLTIGSNTIEIVDENSRKEVCRAESITTYRTGIFGLLGDPAVRVECAIDPRRSPSKQGSNQAVEWAINITQEIEGHALGVAAHVESEDGILDSGPILFEPHR